MFERVGRCVSAWSRVSVWSWVAGWSLAGVLLVLAAAPAAGQDPAGREMIGEVLAVDPAAGSLAVLTPEGASCRLYLAPDAAVTRDGQPSSLWALRPVAAGFCQEVRLRLDAKGRVLAVDGSYPGCEAQVVAAGAGELTFTTLDGALVTRPLTAGCRVERGGRDLDPGALRPGEWVYILLDLNGQVKKIASFAGDRRDNAA